jgi:hypothetical protein
MLGKAKSSPKTRGVPDLEERAKKLRKFEKWGDQTPVSEDQFRIAIGAERWQGYWQRLDEIKQLMVSAQEEADSIRMVLETKFGDSKLAG